ncbi:hypothetical protein HPB48_019411 [Haemaphysalis longicornis]|uniref:Uncharacterized protein n=1 Tax=Haemaphysalis longicornis TaxID=44386 RepID=A0A9J6GKK4_HAELO|nr:hypothetical protein HPB48_019411 [Haemaphysalis longicornis]
MAGCAALSGAALACLLVVCGSIPGGWRDQDPQSSPKYKKLAHFAVSQHVEGLENYDTVLDLIKVETQVRNTVIPSSGESIAKKISNEWHLTLPYAH